MEPMDGIDGGIASMIIDRCQVPDDLDVKPHYIKSVLWCLRGIGAPGTQIRCVHETIQKRTQISRSMVYRCMKELQDAKLLVQTRSAAPHQSAAYIMRYDRILDSWCEPDDQEYIRMAINRSQPGTRQRVSGGDTSKSTGPQPGRTCPEPGRTGVQRGPVIKEEPAVPAEPAPPPSPSTDEIDRWLLNLAAGGGAGGVGVMDQEAWERLARHAGIGVARQRERFASILVARGVQDAEIGLAALEKIKQRLSDKHVKSPEGLFTSFLDPSKDLTGECDRTRERRRIEDQERRAVAIKIREQWGEPTQRQVSRRIRAMLNTSIGEVRAQAVFKAWHTHESIRDWDAMLAFVTTHYSKLTAAKKPEGAAA